MFIKFINIIMYIHVYHVYTSQIITKFLTGIPTYSAGCRRMPTITVA